jgi:hypothetical protein
MPELLIERQEEKTPELVLEKSTELRRQQN